MKPYPPAPWHLEGHGVQTIQLVDIASIREDLPGELSIVQLWPGKTLGIIGFAHYGPGSVLEYDELIIAPALVRHQGRLGVWVSHIYVDLLDSLHGGREIWGVPKELADFEWHDDGKNAGVCAHMDGRPLCRIECSRRWWLMRKRMKFPTFSHRDKELFLFVGDVQGRIAWGRGKVDIPAESPLSEIRRSRPWMTIWIEQMTLDCGKPEAVGRTMFVPLRDLSMQPAGA